MKHKISYVILAAAMLAMLALAGCSAALNDGSDAQIYSGDVTYRELRTNGFFPYEHGVKFLGVDVYFGHIENAQMAATIAERVWIKMYGEEIVKYRPYLVDYDASQHMWFVYTDQQNDENRLICYLDGETGKLLAVNFEVAEGYDKSNWVEYPVGIDPSGLIYDYVGDFNAIALSEDYGGPYFRIDENGEVANLGEDVIRLGKIENALDAAHAFEIGAQWYGEEAVVPPYLVYYDEETDIWMVVGGPAKDSDSTEAECGGGWITMLFKGEDGELLYDWIGV